DASSDGRSRGASCKLLKMGALLLKMGALRFPRSGHLPGRIGEERAGPGSVARRRALAQIAVETVVPQLARAARAAAAGRVVVPDAADGRAPPNTRRLDLNRMDPSASVTV